MNNLNYTSTNVDNDKRKSLGLTFDEYCLIDFVSRGHQSIQSISEVLGISKSGASQMTNRLISRGYLRRQTISDSDAMGVICDGEVYRHGCVACGSLKNIHRHHYPVRREHGGTETVSLCSNCHAEFHLLADHGMLSVVIQWNRNK